MVFVGLGEAVIKVFQADKRNGFFFLSCSCSAKISVLS